MGISATLLRDVDHGGAAGQPGQVAASLLEYIRSAQHSLHIAVYDFRLDPNGPYYAPVVAALKERAAAGVAVQIAFDQGKQIRLPPGADPAPPGSERFLQQAFAGTAVQYRGITDRNPMHQEPKLMHSKYLVRDGAAVWTGSVNLTEDAWTFQENNLVVVESAPLAAYYETDFQELWTSGDIQSSGQNDLGSVQVGSSTLDVAFSPGEGPTIDTHVANLITSARRRIKIASMLIASRLVLAALQRALQDGQVSEFGGIYDSTQMEETIANWQRVPQNQMYVPIFEGIAQQLSSKASLPYDAGGKHNFMHDKVVVCDDSVFTGSFNLSHSATQNAENALIIHDPQVADQYAQYIDQVAAAYRS